MLKKQTPARDFLEIHIVPNLEAWKRQATDIRLAMNASVSLYHMADHFWHTYKNLDQSRVFYTATSGKSCSELTHRNPHFAVIRDVAEAHKHMKLDRTPRAITQPNQTSVGSTSFGEGVFGAGPFGGGPSIIVELDDGTKHHLSYIAKEVKSLWLTLLT